MNTPPTGFTNLSDEEYNKLCDHRFSERNISREALEKCISIVNDFCYDYLTKEQLTVVHEMTREEKIRLRWTW